MDCPYISLVRLKYAPISAQVNEYSVIISQVTLPEPHLITFWDNKNVSEQTKEKGKTYDSC